MHKWAEAAWDVVARLLLIAFVFLTIFGTLLAEFGALKGVLIGIAVTLALAGIVWISNVFEERRKLKERVARLEHEANRRQNDAPKQLPGSGG